MKGTEECELRRAIHHLERKLGKGKPSRHAASKTVVGALEHTEYISGLAESSRIDRGDGR